MLGAGFYNMDCMKALKEYPDGYFQLAIVDPPYGHGNAGGGVLPIHPGRMVQPVQAGEQHGTGSGDGSTDTSGSRDDGSG